MKRCAVILSGFLRDEANLVNLKTFLTKNAKEFSIDFFVYTYDVIGLKTKASKKDFRANQNLQLLWLYQRDPLLR